MSLRSFQPTKTAAPDPSAIIPKGKPVLGSCVGCPPLVVLGDGVVVGCGVDEDFGNGVWLVKIGCPVGLDFKVDEGATDDTSCLFACVFVRNKYQPVDKSNKTIITPRVGGPYFLKISCRSC